MAGGRLTGRSWPDLAGRPAGEFATKAREVQNQRVGDGIVNRLEM